MTLKDFILTYEVDEKIVVNLYDYYEKFIRHVDKRFEQYSYYDDNLVLCYLPNHQDINPSMGSIASKFHKKVRVCHCFGCGKTYDVVKLHQVISATYYNKDLTEVEACYELASAFNVPLDDFDELAEDDYEGKLTRQIKSVDRLSNSYTIREFSQGLLAIRCSGNVDLNKVNSECVKMIATIKQLYN